jgi:TolB-like protein/Tfp pilus assembly protein PilF
VLPFQNLSGDASQDYLVDGVTDALIGDLAQIGALRVISRTSAMHYKGTNKSLPEIAKELNVDAVVEGTVQRSGERVHVRAQLIHAASDSHLWAADYDRDARDILDLQSEVARAIASEVRIKITPAEQRLLVPKRTVARAAIDNYLQGRYFWNRRTEQDIRKAIGYFEAAISADPNYAQAYAGLADSYNQLGTVMIGVMPPSEARRTGEAAARKGLEIDNEVAEAHAALGYENFFNWNWASAEEEFKRSIQLNPNYATAHSHYGLYLVARERIDEGIAEINRAEELDPLSLSISSSRGFLLLNARRYEEAIEQQRRVIAIDPNHYQAHWFLALTYLANGQIDRAIATSEKAVAISNHAPAAVGVLGMAYGAGGRKREANQLANELLQLEKERYVSPMAFVYVYIGLGDKDRAFAWLEKAYQERSNHIAFFKVSPTVDSVRSDVRFGDLLRRIGLDSDQK